jgi:hypothetical protein
MKSHKGSEEMSQGKDKSSTHLVSRYREWRWEDEMLRKLAMPAGIVVLAVACGFAGEAVAARSEAVGTGASVATQQSGTSTPSKKPSKKKQRKHKKSSSKHKKPSNSK